MEGSTPRAVFIPLRCPRCLGPAYLEPDIPGLFDILCLHCSRLIGEIGADDLAAVAEEPKAVDRAETKPISFLWYRLK